MLYLRTATASRPFKVDQTLRVTQGLGQVIPNLILK